LRPENPHRTPLFIVIITLVAYLARIIERESSFEDQEPKNHAVASIESDFARIGGRALALVAAQLCRRN